MNPLGWKSAIYNLGRSVDMPMGDVADSLLHGVRNARSGGAISPSAEAALVGDQLISGLGASRQIYDETLTLARSGADDARVTGEFDYLVGNLRATEQVRMSGTAVGHVRGARQAAEEVATNLRQGLGPQSDGTHEAMWRLRFHLNEGWNAIGSAKVMGELRGITSVT